jgi:hypothetical protein
MCNHSLQRTLEVATLAGLLAIGAVRASAADFQVVRDDSTISISDGQRPVLRYRYANVPMKPYADQLVSPAGVQVLRDSPHDHKHHHGLMYALAVDDVNFWEELPKSGRQRQTSLVEVKPIAREGVDRAGFVQELN